MIYDDEDYSVYDNYFDNICIICLDSSDNITLCYKCKYLYCIECAFKINYNCSICLRKNISITNNRNIFKSL